MSAVGATPASAQLLRDLLEQIAAHLPPERAEVVSRLARAYVRRLPAAAAAELDGEALFGQVMGLFELADGRGLGSIAARALTPTLANDGYATVGSVVETNAPDSPFLVDSVTEELAARGLSVRLVLHPVVGVERDGAGSITSIGPAKGAASTESIMHFEVDRRLAPAELDDLAQSVRRILADVRSVVDDFPAMLDRVDRLVEAAEGAAARFELEEIDEAVAFLEWLRDENMVLLGYREYATEGDGDERTIRVVPGSGLGILRDEASSAFAGGVRVGDVEPEVLHRMESGDLLTVSKTRRVSTVHRRARMDYVGVKTLGPDGAVTGERRLLGLFTSKAYMEPADTVPIARRKLQQVLAAEDLVPGSHDYKVAVTLVENFPLDELLPRRRTRCARRSSSCSSCRSSGRCASSRTATSSTGACRSSSRSPATASTPRLRHRLQALFMERFRGTSVDYHLALGETDPAQIHFRIHVADGTIPDISFAELENEVVALARTWDDRLLERLVAAHGEERGRTLWTRWEGRFPEYYKTSTEVTRAVLDIEQLERLRDTGGLVVALHNEHGAGELLTRLLLYKTGGRAELSAVMPMLEALGLSVVEEVPVRVAGSADDPDAEIFIHDYGVLGPGGEPLDVASVANRVSDAVTAVWHEETDSDGLDRLVILAGLTWREVAWLRAMRTYLLRVSAGFTLAYQNDTFAGEPGDRR